MMMNHLQVVAHSLDKYPGLIHGVVKAEVLYRPSRALSCAKGAQFG
jgi:hypothetical protein